jgi:hypothetical protein
MIWLTFAFVVGLAIGAHAQQYLWWKWLEREHPDAIQGRRWWK